MKYMGLTERHRHPRKASWFTLFVIECLFSPWFWLAVAVTVSGIVFG